MADGQSNSKAQLSSPRKPLDAAAKPRKKFRVLHLFSGPADIGPNTTTLKGLVERIAADQVTPPLNLQAYEIDFCNCACTDENGKQTDEYCSLTHNRWGHPRSAADLRRQPCGNLMRDETYNDLLRDCKRGAYALCVAGIPCNGYCIAKHSDRHNARPLRSRDHPCGLPIGNAGRGVSLYPQDVKNLATSNSLTVRGLSLCAAVFESGGEALIENPPDRGVQGLWATTAWRGETLEERLSLRSAHHGKALPPLVRRKSTE